MIRPPHPQHQGAFPYTRGGRILYWILRWAILGLVAFVLGLLLF